MNILFGSIFVITNNAWVNTILYISYYTHARVSQGYKASGTITLLAGKSMLILLVSIKLFSQWVAFPAVVENS